MSIGFLGSKKWKKDTRSFTKNGDMDKESYINKAAVVEGR
jgi:hypothetical protein